MKLTIFAVLVGAVVVTAGCVSTVNDHSTAGVPFTRDRVEGRYERSVDQVFQATKTVVRRNGTMVNESTIYGQTNEVRTVQGQLKEDKVWVRIQEVNPRVTSVTVQARTSNGGANLDLAHEIDKQIALELTK